MEEFFYASAEIDDYLKYEETLFRRFNNPTYILSLDFLEGLELIVESFKKEKEERIWQLYVSKYPLMNQDNFISYEEFLNTLYPEYLNNLSNQEISHEELHEQTKNIINLTLERERRAN